MATFLAVNWPYILTGLAIGAGLLAAIAYGTWVWP
jgi:hypothetical protein